jgi:hypothetical protein
MMETTAKNDERRRAVNPSQRFADLKSHPEGGTHWRVQRDVDPAAIYAHYEKYRVRRRWAIIIIAALSALSWLVVLLLAIAAFSVV